MSPVSRQKQAVNNLVRSRTVGVVTLTITQAGLGSAFAVLSARALGPNDRGVIVLVSTLGTLLSLLGSLGIATGGRMLLSRSDPRHSITRQSSTAFQLGGIHIVTVALVGWPLLRLSGGWRGWPMGGAFLLYCVAMVIILVLREGAHGVGRHRFAVGADALMAGMQVLGLLALLARHQRSLLALLWLMATCAVLEVIVLASSNARWGPHPEGTGITLSELAGISAPAMAGALGHSFALRGDRVILGLLADPHAVGLYGTAATFTETMWLVPAALSQVVFRYSSQRRQDLIRKARRLNWAIAAAVSALGALLAEPVVNLLLGPAYRDAIPLIWLLIIAGLPMAGYFVECAVLNGAGQLGGPARATTSGALVLAVACLLLIPGLGAAGAAIASMLAYATMATIVARRSSRLKREDGHD